MAGSSTAVRRWKSWRPPSARGARLAPEDLGEGIETVAGLVNALAGRVPQRRELIEHPEGFAIEVLVADPRRVKRVRIRRAPTVQAGD